MRWEVAAVMLGREGIGDWRAFRWLNLRSMYCPVESPRPDHVRSLQLDPQLQTKVRHLPLFP